MMNGLSSEGRKNISGIKIGNAPTAFGERGGIGNVYTPLVSPFVPLANFSLHTGDRKKFAILIRMVGQQQRRLKLRLKNRIRVF